MIAIEELPCTTFLSVVLTTVPLVFLWTYLIGHVAKHGAYKWAETVYETHNFIIATISLALAAYVLDIGHDILTVRTGYQVDPKLLGYIYHLLKIYEYFDIVLLILSGTTTISKYTAFSHLSLPYWSYYRVIHNDAYDWRFQVITDCTVRFLSRAIPWLVEDVRNEEILLSMAEEWRWYPDLAISAFWATFMFQDKRNSEEALQAFGKPNEDEFTARFLSIAVMLYASLTKRQDDSKKVRSLEAKGIKQTSRVPSNVTSTPAGTSASSRASQKPKKN